MKDTGVTTYRPFPSLQQVPLSLLPSIFRQRPVHFSNNTPGLSGRNTSIQHFVGHMNIVDVLRQRPCLDLGDTGSPRSKGSSFKIIEGAMYITGSGGETENHGKSEHFPRILCTSAQVNILSYFHKKVRSEDYNLPRPERTGCLGWSHGSIR